MAIIQNFQEQIAEEEKRIPNVELTLGKSAMQPFNNMNSGSRTIMYSIQIEHAISVENPEVPIVSTGYENRFGDESSSILKAEVDYEIVGKISKFQEEPNHDYYLITRRYDTGELGIIHRIGFHHLTESYGYKYNNTKIDKIADQYDKATLDLLEPELTVSAGEIYRKSCAYDEYMNRMDGVNLNVAYISNNKTMEDGIQISKTAARKLSSPLYHKITVTVNDNDILLNLYADNTGYKTFPNIGEEVRSGMLCAIRREKTDEALFMQSIERLREPLTSDQIFYAEGKVVDINIFCNNRDTVAEKYSNNQLDKYYQDHRRFLEEFMTTIDMARDKFGNVKMSNDLTEMYYFVSEEYKGTTFSREKEYTGTVIEFIVQEISDPRVGDKITNRYGGKGIISEILQDEMMPRLNNGDTIDVLFNSSTCVNRLNPGQLMEQSINFISAQILDYLNNNVVTHMQAIDMIYRFLKIVEPTQADEWFIMVDSCDKEDSEWLIEEMIEDRNILVSISPSRMFSLDLLNELYKEFPFIKRYEVYSPIRGSRGDVRFVRAYRDIIAGKMYIYRLKQYAEEKFSATSLSSTDIIGNNAKNKASKNHNKRYSDTAIRFGEMEQQDEFHIGVKVNTLMKQLHANSPESRRRIATVLDGDPYVLNIEVGKEDKNRSVEVLNTYLKTMGLRLSITKTKKEKINLLTPILLKRVVKKDPLLSPIDKRVKYDAAEEQAKNFKIMQKFDRMPLRAQLLTPVEEVAEMKPWSIFKTESKGD